MPHNPSAKDRRRAEVAPLPPGLREGLEERASAKAAFVADVQAEQTAHEELHRTTTAKIAEVEEFDSQWGEYFEANGRYGLLTGEEAERRRRDLDIYHRKRVELIECLGLENHDSPEAEPIDEPKPVTRLVVTRDPPHTVLDGASQPLDADHQAATETAPELPNHARNRFIYDLACRGVEWKSIRRQVADQAAERGWRGLKNVRHLMRIPKQFASAEGLPLPPPRKSGRKPAGK